LVFVQFALERGVKSREMFFDFPGKMSARPESELLPALPLRLQLKIFDLLRPADVIRLSWVSRQLAAFIEEQEEEMPKHDAKLSCIYQYWDKWRIALSVDRKNAPTMPWGGWGTDGIMLK
jgi:hypothetical protein